MADAVALVVLVVGYGGIAVVGTGKYLLARRRAGRDQQGDFVASLRSNG